MPGQGVTVLGATSTVQVKPHSSRMNPGISGLCCPSCHWASQFHRALESSSLSGSLLPPVLPPARQNTGQMLCLLGLDFSISVAHGTQLDLQRERVR